MRARSEVAELRLVVELLAVRVESLEAGHTPDAADAVAWASAYSVQWRRRFHLARVCRAWNLSRATVYRHRVEVRRRKPVSAWSDAEIVRRLRELIEASPFPAERYRKLWHRLRAQGVLVNKERVRQLINQHELLPAYGTIVAERPDMLWGIDSARVKTEDGSRAAVLFAVDHCTGECLAIDVVPEETYGTWLALILAAVDYAFDSRKAGVATGLRIRCDNLPAYRDKRFCGPLERLGIRTSYIAPLTPRSNGMAERFVRTLRDNRLGVRFWPTLEELGREMRAFREVYNGQYLLQRWGYRSPEQVRELFKQAG